MICYQPKRLFKITLAIFKICLVVLLSPLALYLQFYIPIAGIGLFVSAIMFLTIGGFEKIVVHPFEDSKDYKECLFGQMYNLEERLEWEKKRRDELYQEQHESWRNVLLGIGLLLLGFGIVLASVLASQILVVLILGVVPGFYIEIMSFDWVWIGYINSSLRIAKRDSELFQVRSTSVKIEECTKKIDVLSNRLREMEEKEREGQRARDVSEEAEEAQEKPLPEKGMAAEALEMQERQEMRLAQDMSLSVRGMAEEALEKSQGVKVAGEVDSGSALDVAPRVETKATEMEQKQDTEEEEETSLQERLLALANSGASDIGWTQEKVWAQEAEEARKEKEKSDVSIFGEYHEI